ncbi:MAG TPA: class I SAM-dependent methyltransferase [Bacteroidales bacterium]|nr:class I SAM-dependent methyltransferase [Bacteroidales bacterium]
MVHYDSCPLCSSATFVLKFNCTDYYVSKEVFPVIECSTCGFTFTGDHPEESEIARYYESDEYISHSDTRQGAVNRLYRLARNFMLVRKTRLVKKVTGIREGKTLDIGSGTGYFAAAMKKEGWHSEGIEINRKARDFSRSEFGLEVFEPSEIKNLKSGDYDCITLWHVLEHFNDPDSYMKEISRLLKQGGKCIIALPNNKSFDSLHYKEFWAAWDVPRHLWHYNPGTFRKYCEKSSFELININTLPLDAVYISILSEKYKKSKLPLIKGAIKGMWFLVESIFNREKASSLVYILEAVK